MSFFRRYWIHIVIGLAVVYYAFPKIWNGLPFVNVPKGGPTGGIATNASGSAQGDG
jgi:hypothetical protein